LAKPILINGRNLLRARVVCIYDSPSRPFRAQSELTGQFDVLNKHWSFGHILIGISC